ncbi:hypothetical protein [Dyella subtropica]|uniref:hypothetical protein n=1 Tax=Dyella subtropica TaxID=2992127 RepID=UPI00225A64D5|nr:hypothetical protein [Dyella subtropica]
MALTSALLAFAGMPNASKAADLFNNTNTMQVNYCPSPFVNCPPRFKLSAPATIDVIQTYHRAGAATAGKTIGLRDASGSMVLGPLQVTTQPASPGFENWIASVGGQQLPAGTYTVIDSQADTWSQNVQSCDGPGVAGAACNKGFAIVRGGAPDPSESITDCSATCTVPPATTSPPAFACSAHGPKSTCKRAAASTDNPGGGVFCTDGKNTTTCNCQTGCTTH